MTNCYCFINPACQHRYAKDGNNVGPVETPPPPPIRLQWDLKNEELLNAIDVCYNTAQKMLNDLDLRILMCTKYGKGNCIIYTELYYGYIIVPNSY